MECAFAKPDNTPDHNATSNGAHSSAPTMVDAIRTPMAIANVTLAGLELLVKSQTVQTTAMAMELVSPMGSVFAIWAFLESGVRTNSALTIALVVEHVLMGNASAHQDSRELIAHHESVQTTAVNTVVASMAPADVSLDSEVPIARPPIAPMLARTTVFARRVLVDAILDTLVTIAASASAPIIAHTMVFARTSPANATLDTPDSIAAC